MADPLAPIDLTRQPDFRLGKLTIKPSTLEVVSLDALKGAREVLEPRVMQVLTALHLAAPNTVSRDDLIAQCWEGRIVGDDAINRAIGRLRKLAESSGAFSIETIPRIGYRLSASNIEAKPQAVLSLPPNNRRALLYAGAGAAAAALAGGAWWLTRAPLAPATVTLSAADAQAAKLIQRGIDALHRGNAAERAEALGDFQDATNLSPQMADAWAGLALVYAMNYRGGNPAKAEANQMRSRDALARAFAIDPKNALGWWAKEAALRTRNYLEKETILRQGLSYHPEHPDLMMPLAIRLAEVGRNREAAALAERVWAKVEPYYGITWFRIQALWSAGRLPEADQAMARGMELFPRSPGVWFARFYVLLFTGRAREALAMLDDTDSHPTGVPLTEYPGDRLVAQALASGAKADIDKAAAAMPEFATMGGGFAENAIEFLSAMGRVDEAFKIAQACYFGRGFAIAQTRFTEVEGGYNVREDGSTWPLFKPSTRLLRKDRRFAGMMDELGLSKYWKDAGVKPDYQVYPE